MADTTQRPFTWTPKEPKHKDEDDANDPFSDDRCYETVNVPGGGTRALEVEPEARTQTLQRELLPAK